MKYKHEIKLLRFFAFYKYLAVSPETSSEGLNIAFKIASFHQLKKEMTLEEVEETLTRLQSKPGVLGTLLVTGFHSQTFWTRVARSVHE